MDKTLLVGDFIWWRPGKFGVTLACIKKSGLSSDFLIQGFSNKQRMAN